MDEHGEKALLQLITVCSTGMVYLQVPFKGLYEELNILYDDFIRTTVDEPRKAVQYLWERMREAGFIYYKDLTILVQTMRSIFLHRDLGQRRQMKRLPGAPLPRLPS